MRKTILFLFLVTHSIAFSQKNKLNVHLVDPDTNTTSELSFLKEYIGDKKYVFLGENAHRCSEYLKMLNKIASYLVNEMGFEVLALELGSAEMYYYQMNKSYGIEPYLLSHLNNPRDNILIDETINNERITICGFDNQLCRFPLYTNYLRSKRDLLGKSLVDSLIWADSSRFILADTYPGEQEKENTFLIKYYQLAIRKIDSLQENMDKSSYAYLKLIFNNHLSWFANIGSYSRKAMNNRDSVMGVNLNTLFTSVFPNKKIIIYAHNYHIYKTLPQDPYSCGYNMISQLSPEILQQSYFITMYGYSGETTLGEAKNFKIKIPNGNYLEALKKPYKNQSIFVDLKANQSFRGLNKRKKVKYFGGTYSETIIPIEVTDAFIILNRLTPIALNIKK